MSEEGGKYRATWPTPAGDESELFPTAAQAVKAVARHADGGLRFHDLRHSYASWLITSGVTVPDVQRVMGHERPTTTLAIYTHVQGGSQERVLGALAAFRCLTRARTTRAGTRMLPGSRADLRFLTVGDTGFEPVTSSV